MTRKPILESLFLVAIAAISGTLFACAAAIVPARNVVVDDDVRGCSADLFGRVGALDVAIVIDTSQSTGLPTGFDIDGDGVVRSFEHNSAIDRGDSRLAAQVAAIKRLLRNADGRGIRFSIITYSGPSVAHTVGRTQLVGSIRDSRVRVNLTNDRAQLDSALTDLLDRGSDGRTIFSAGMQRATRSLIRDSSQLGRQRRKLVLLMSDSAKPNSIDLDGNFERVDPRMKNAAITARGHEVIIHTFGLSPDSRMWRRQPLGQIAGATGGTYHPVEDPEQFYCHLAKSLVPPSRHARPLRTLATKQDGSPQASLEVTASEELASRR